MNATDEDVRRERAAVVKKHRLTPDHERVLAMFDKDPKHWLNGDDAWILIDLVEADLVTLHSVIAQRKGWSR
jgi:hypothetical protein